MVVGGTSVQFSLKNISSFELELARKVESVLAKTN